MDNSNNLQLFYSEFKKEDSPKWEDLNAETKEYLKQSLTYQMWKLRKALEFFKGTVRKYGK